MDWLALTRFASSLNSKKQPTFEYKLQALNLSKLKSLIISGRMNFSQKDSKLFLMFLSVVK